jgi:aminoglycoside 6'-N-acetyltransferase I
LSIVSSLHKSNHFEDAEMRTEIRLSNHEDANIIKNLWPLYRHDISQFDGSMPNRHGLFIDDETIVTLAEQGETQAAWWQNPESLFPYLILADGYPAGFNLIATHPYVPESIKVDFVIHEFFVLRPFRGKGVAEQATIQGFHAHRGRWEVVTYPNHPRAIAFWQKVLRRYAPDKYTEKEIDHSWGRKVTFTFDNSTKG